MLSGLLGNVYFAKEYQSGDLATQRSILNNLSKFGVQKAIFKLQGVEHKDLSEEEQAEVLEELLTAQEKLFGYERHVERHGKFRVLDRFLFKWSEGQTLDTATTSQTQSVSTATNLKKTGSARAVEMMKHGGSLTEGDEDGEPSTAKPSESFGLLKEKRRELESFRTRLSKTSEDLLFVLTQVRSLEDSSWAKKESELQKACTALDGFLQKIRSALAEKLPQNVADDYTTPDWRLGQGAGGGHSTREGFQASFEDG
ncbi:unnamed protein product [Symbiodinium natans]|uniref:Uncharacterized protein n=1 Tax=Symbiodinium natans TaxID=878477 RepID=A0A812QXI8_9DINO|nr:unnamed protein product [Symbiodinium natans]